MQKRLNVPLNKFLFNTPLGEMLGVADDRYVKALYFSDHKNLPLWIEGLSYTKTALLNTLEQEVLSYFKGSLKNFTVPVSPTGTSFQKKAWQALTEIPYGHTSNYGVQARKVGCDKGFRAIGTANRTSPISIAVPCHRVIKADGSVGGYAGTQERKVWLLSHEACINNLCKK